MPGIETLAHPVFSKSPDGGQILLAALSKNWARFEYLYKKTRRRPRRGNVHELRKTARQLNAVLELASAAASGGTGGLASRLNGVLKATGRLRDIQVQLKRAKTEAPATLKCGRFRRRLKKLEAAGCRRVKKRLTPGALKKARKLLARAESRLSGAVFADGHAAIAPSAKIETAYLEACDRLAALRNGLKAGDDESFHRFRIQMKNVSYKIGILEPVLKLHPGEKNFLENERKCLGDLQDKVVFLTFAKGCLSKRRSKTGHPRRELKDEILDIQKSQLSALRPMAH